MQTPQTGLRSNKISELLGNNRRKSFTSAEISALAKEQDLTAANKFRRVSLRSGLSAGEVSAYYRGVIEAFLLTLGNEIKFDQDRVYGYSADGIYAAGDFTIDLTGADTSKTVLVYHEDYVKPTFDAGATTVNESGDYVEGVLNIIRLDYDGSEINIAYHAQV